MAKKLNSADFTIGIVGTGTMGRGIAQIMAAGGMNVLMFDSKEGAAEEGRTFAKKMLLRAAEKGTISEVQAKAAVGQLSVVEALHELSKSDVVIEAALEDLKLKRNLFESLEKIVSNKCVLATNTSSLSVTAIAAVLANPSRFAGFHFFNPVPLMKIVEIINGVQTSSHAIETLTAVAKRSGHEPVRTKDTPGFLVNHAGRGLNTEGIRIISEGITNFSGVDDLLREGGPEFRLGPFELMDITGLDVSQPVMESIYRQFYEEPRFRPGPLMRQRIAAGLFGRKSGQGFYLYDKNTKVAEPPIEVPKTLPKSVWVSNSEPDERKVLVAALQGIVEIDDRPQPSTKSLCLFTPLGLDVTTVATAEGIEAERSFATDTMFGLGGRRALMCSPLSDPELRDQMHGLLAANNHSVTVIHDSPGFVNQRVVAIIVNIACDIAQQRIASPEDIDKAVQLGLGYPQGPLAMGDSLKPSRLLRVLERMQAFYGDPRYRPSPWLKRRALLGVSLLTKEN